MTALPALLAVLLYRRHLAEGFLADDFQYANWARAGIGVLLRHVTIGSAPQMIRPLPGLAWMLSRVPLGAALLHGASVLLHAANGLLVALILTLSRGDAAGSAVPQAAAGEPGAGWTAPAFAALFVAFPLFTEPVIWLSASFDLWACGFALAAVWLADRGAGRWAPAAAAGLYLAALLCKESVVCLPLVLAALFPWRRIGRSALAMAGVAGAYVAVRLLLFSGPGGYQDSAGSSSVLWSATPRSVWMMAQQLPPRVLVPFKGAAEFAKAQLLCGLVSAVLIGGFLLTAMAVRRRRPGAPALSPAPASRSAAGAVKRFLLPVLAVFLALLPVAHLLWIEVDQEGSRLLYFPLAVAAIALGLRTPSLSALARGFAVALVGYWSLATVWNGRAWTHAGWEVDHTLAAMTGLAPHLPARATVLVAGHDSWQGAYTWRNGVPAAARWRGLRPDASWSLGTVALLDSPADELGARVFEIGIDDAGRPVDWTPCERALLTMPPEVLVNWALPFPPLPGRDPVSPQLLLARPVEDLQVRLELGGDRPSGSVPGRLFWRPAGLEHFAVVNSANFFLGPRAAAEIVLRLHPEPPRPMSSVKLWLHMPPPALAYVRAIRVGALPALCSSAASPHLDGS